jgi:FkbM family methyltransferase
VVQPLNLIRRAAALPGLKRLTTVTPVIRATGALRAGLVREHRRFALNELRARDVVARYTLRSDDVQVMIRHHSSDVMVLDEIFSANEYAFPTEVATALDGVASPHVVDLGGNIGLFGAWTLARYPTARLISYEPDPGNAMVHERVIEANRAGDRWKLHRAAAAPADGTLTFLAGHGSTSRVIDSATRPEGDVIVVDARDPFPDLSGADFIKIDIEGGEWGLLADPRFATLTARAACVEYHPDGALGQDPGADAQRLMHAAGFVVRDVPKANMPGYGVVWGWR